MKKNKDLFELLELPWYVLALNQEEAPEVGSSVSQESWVL